MLAIADSVGKEVLLSVRPLGQSNEEAVSSLIRFYEPFGFVVVEREAGLAHMRRPALPTISS